MTIVFCNPDISTKLNSEILLNKSISETEFDFVQKVDELNTKLVLQKNKTVSLVIFSDSLYKAFNNNTDQIISYMGILKALGKFNLTYIAESPESDVVAKHLANNGVKNIIRRPQDDRISMEYVSECVICQNDFSTLKDLVDLRNSNIETVVLAYRFLIDKVYSKLSSPDLQKLLSNYREKFLDIEFKLNSFSSKVTEIEDMIKLKNTQLEAYESKMDAIKSQFDSIVELKDKLVEQSVEKDGEIAYLTMQNKSILEHQEAVLESLKDNGNLVYYSTKDVDRLGSKLKAVIVFKEYSYSRYFNTFIKYLYNYMGKQMKDKPAYKTRVVIYDRNLDGSGIVKFRDFYPCIGTDYADKIADRDFLITNEVRSDFMRSIVEGESSYEVLIVIDRRKDFTLDMYKGTRVARFVTANSTDDVRAFNIPEACLVSSGIPNAAIFIPTIGAFSLASRSEISEAVQYKELVIKPFMAKLTSLYEISL